jgi:hypothetical protein
MKKSVIITLALLSSSVLSAEKTCATACDPCDFNIIDNK